MTAGIGILRKTTLVDYPGRVASALFLKGCNLRCPYCFNAELVTGTIAEEEAVTLEEVAAHLEKRKNVISGFVISGGEALLSPYLADIIRTARSFGYAVKLDTNGTLPELLAALLHNPELQPDFVALDIKTSPERYPELSAAAIPDESSCMLPENIRKSIQLVSALPADRREFRTVLVPPLVGETEIRTIAALLPPDATWRLARFRNENCLDRTYNDVVPYPDADVQKLENTARALIPDTAVR